MIEYEEAQNLILAHTRVLPPEMKDISDADSCILAEDIRARVDLPVFSNSAMDGYALRAEETSGAPVLLKVTGRLKAGDFPRMKVRAGEAVKIMTGAALPEGADAVVMVEDTEEMGRNVLVKKAIEKGANVRLKGEEIKKGRIALKKGTKLNPAALGFLSSLGYGKGKVYGRPRVYLLATGSELVKAGLPLEPGQIWESNSTTLAAALKGIHIEPIFSGFCRDNRSVLGKRIEAGLQTSDVLLITGGISVGDYDLVQETLVRFNVKKIFWRTAIKPGKPMFFGVRGKKPVFGLPGNPASVLLTFLEFVRPALLKMMGETDLFLQEKEAVLEEEIKKKAGRVSFLRGMFREKEGETFVGSAGLQYSHVLDSFSRANCLIILDKDRELFRKGERVRIHVLPWWRRR
jgi:molybdopterin molybdotransferase